MGRNAQRLWFQEGSQGGGDQAGTTTGSSNIVPHARRPKAKKIQAMHWAAYFCLFFLRPPPCNFQRKYKTRHRLGFKHTNTVLEFKALLITLLQENVSLLQGTSVFLRNKHDFSSSHGDVLRGKSLLLLFDIFSM